MGCGTYPRRVALGIGPDAERGVSGHPEGSQSATLVVRGIVLYSARMLNADLLEYIRTQLQRGMSEREIRKILAEAGWEQNEVNQTLSLSVYEGDHDIETRDLTKFYGKKRGVLSLDLFVRQGEIFGFLGPNGAGKSTAIRLLLRLIRPTSGSIRIFGKDPQTAYASILSNVGYLPGDVGLYEKMTGRKLLDLR